MQTEEIRIVFLTNEELRKALDGFAKKNQLSRSDVVRLALKKFLYDGNGDLSLVR